MAEEVWAFDKYTAEQLIRMMREHQLEMDNLRRNLSALQVRRIRRRPSEKPIPFKNNANETMPAWGIGRPTGITPSSGDPFLQIEKPSSTFCPWYLVNSSGVAVPSGSYGSGLWLVAGGQAYYSTGTPAFGEEWGPTSGDWGLVKNRPGFWVQGAATDTTNKYVRVIQREVTAVLGKTDSSHAKSASGTVSVYCGTAGSESDTGWDITAYNKFAAVGSSKWVLCTKVHGNWYLSAAEC